MTTRAMTQMRLYVNIDHVATIRQARRTDEPDPVEAATLAEQAGADGITAHLREDRRHVQDDDVIRLAAAVRTVLNLELAMSDEIVELACRLKPYQATLVPERREEITTEGGLDLARDQDRRRAIIEQLKAAGIRVSLFVDPTIAAMEASAALGVPAVELHTGTYAHTWRRDSHALDQLAAATTRARTLGLAVHAGHGLTRFNVGPVAAISGLEEVNIGHSIISRSVFIGLAAAIAEIRKAMDQGLTR